MIDVYPKYWVCLQYHVIPDVSGYPLPNDFQNQIGSGRVLKKIPGSRSGSGTRWALLRRPIFQYIPPLSSVLLHDKLPEIICEDKWVLWQTWVLIFFGGCQFLSGWQGTSAPALTTLQNWQPANITLVLAAPLQNTNAHKRNTEQTKTKHKWQPTKMARLLWNKWRWLQIWSTVHISIFTLATCRDEPTSQRFKYSTAGRPLPG